MIGVKDPRPGRLSLFLALSWGCLAPSTASGCTVSWAWSSSVEPDVCGPQEITWLGPQPVHQSIAEQSPQQVPREGRAALCFFGQVKNINATLASNFVDNVLGPIARRFPKVDVFLNTYDLEEFTNPRNGEVNVAIDVRWSLHMLLSAIAAHESTRPSTRIRVVNVTITPPQEADETFRDLEYYMQRGDPWENGGSSMKFFLRQLYSLDRVTRLWEGTCRDQGHMSSGVRRPCPYDLVVYTRPDLLFFTGLELSNNTVQKENGQVHRHTLFTPSFDRWGGLNDRFALGAPEVMLAYGHRMHMIDVFFEKHPHAKLQAEVFLHEMMITEAGFASRYLNDFVFARVRADGKHGRT